DVGGQARAHDPVAGRRLDVVVAQAEQVVGRLVERRPDDAVGAVQPWPLAAPAFALAVAHGAGRLRAHRRFLERRAPAPVHERLVAPRRAPDAARREVEREAEPAAVALGRRVARGDADARGAVERAAVVFGAVIEGEAALRGVPPDVDHSALLALDAPLLDVQEV